MTVAGDVERARYLGCTLEISYDRVTVYAPDGRLIAKMRSVAAARRVVKGYRKASA